ncbi:hypothetical protein QDW18_gp24 [Microbacterium phage Katzastrophic]|uniref:hypothetical protein n=1 Tax=Microbacterium phage Katzastrophic TaxID=2912654 RepID=UPI00242D4F05|nr:hypothetical protein QDW18_gp24 [Microbacterium phage Katzastrophic]UKH48461.1 hypothetical protein SEA_KATZASTROPHIC_24 [Microbacterium phage Katzastrophic]
MTDNRIPCPSFDVTLFALLDVVEESPEQTARHAYLDSAGYPHDLVAHVLNRLDAPINTAASGTYEFNGTKRFNSAHLPTLWNRLFLDGNGEDTPYDGRFVTFLEMARLRRPAEDYLIYALLGHVQRANDRSNTTWRSAAHRGIKTFRTFLNSPTSGFLVQTHGAHEDLRQYVDTITATALADLKKK